MNRKSILGIISAALISLAAYLMRRRIIAGLLSLRQPRCNVLVQRRIPIRMADGIKLYGDHFTPIGGGLYPTILIRTPYGRGGPVGPTGLLHDFIAQRFAERGYNVFLQDVRGCYDSEGEFEPFLHEAEDGRATLKWIEEQPWFNGVLGMWGPSYLGYVQWAVAANAPLYIKAIMPMITGSDLVKSSFRDGSLPIDMILRWIIQLEALDRKSYVANWFGLGRMLPSRMDRVIERASMDLPLSDLDLKTVGEKVPFVREWLQHIQPNDPYWEQFDRRVTLDRVTASTHMVTGWYDIFLRETLQDYQTLILSHCQRPFLTIGPWHHVDPDCLLESLRLGIDWFDAQLKGQRGDLKRKTVRLYVMGRDAWREFDSWPPESQPLAYFLHHNQSSLQDTAGGLSPQPAGGDQVVDTYTYDPNNPTPAVGGAVMNYSAGAVDNRDLEARPDVLTFTSEPLEDPLEVIGPVRLELFVLSSLEYTDFFGRLCDVYPDGRSINICDGLCRIDPETGTIKQDGTRLIEIDIWSTAYQFKPGHRLRLQVSSGAHPRWYRNLGTGEPLDTANTALVARQSVFHDQDHPSVLYLPKYDERR